MATKTPQAPSPDAQLASANKRLQAVQDRDAEVSQQLHAAQAAVAELKAKRADLVKQAAAGKTVDLDGFSYRIIEAEARVADIQEMRTHVLAPMAEINADIDAANALVKERQAEEFYAKLESQRVALNETLRVVEQQWATLRDGIEAYRLMTETQLNWLEVAKQEIRQDGLTWRGGGGTSGPELRLPEIGKRHWL